ncbi:MAG: bifunctional [glutamate--ammonia ligase]-adenylyl-L-tyrosine phosphorylase/[glutamate--ammonia-ligase] adenylyltransferase [Deltaproteobacteria bacterium]|nr:bifunctional [glutamate--ammonia ligase]-adenylyl-L-tyrosine phosphorylase/[glutamate--ammonia-ligase] adenylyltransferase [Deltaproteobacteria bacterium]
MQPLRQELEKFGVDPQRLGKLKQILRANVPDFADALYDGVADVPDPAMALANLESLLDAAGGSRGLKELTVEDRRALFILLGSSPSLCVTLTAAGPSWAELLKECLRIDEHDAARHAAVLAPAWKLPWEGFAEQLRRYRHHEYLRIGLNDLIGRYSIERTVQQLSELASGLFVACYNWARDRLREDYGEMRLSDREGDRDNAFVVLAMGKLGGGELNFSSDVDVVYLYESDVGLSSGGVRGQIEPRAFFTKLAESITRAMQEVTPAGFAFRVDLRLRPDGMNGPIANSAANSLLYYESYGQTWERTALIQARPTAGSTALGERFLNDVRPFVFRRYLDYTTVADMKQMKARVESELGAKSRGNVKLGRGGVREIEFVVQVLQLINGGRDERVRTRGTLNTLRRLTACRYLPEGEGVALADAYRFLRDVEHKIQIVHQRQTHAVPKDARDQETLARRLGYRGDDAAARFWVDLERQTAIVRRAFEQLFYEPAAETQRVGDATAEQLIRILDDGEASIPRLRELGFAQPESAQQSLLLLRDGPRSAPASPRRRKVLYDLAPALLACIRQSANPDLALENMATFVSSVGARTSFLVLLRENPGTLRMMVELFGASQFLANSFLRHPEMLDSLVRADLVRVHRTLVDLCEELDSLRAGASDFEEALDVLRRFRNQEFLRIGINDLQGLLEPEDVAAQLALLAEACVRCAAKLATEEVCARYGWRSLSGRFAVIAMGKLGGGELNYNSDLDLIFVYDEGGDESARVMAHERFTKIVQRLITILQVNTKEGLAYRIDTRLRPSGRSGPLVTSLDGFQHYHEESAQLWERQALIKARPITGDPELIQAVEDVIETFVYRAPLTRDDVREIRRLRFRMERELARETQGHVNIKTGRGGLVDVEFVTQMLQLRYGTEESSVRSRRTLDALVALGTVGVLPESDQRILIDGYQFIRRVEHGLRLAYDRPVEDLERGDIDVGVVARRMGFAGDAAAAGEALWREFAQRRETIRACYDRWFDRCESGAV